MPSYLLAYHGGRMPETKEALEQVTAAWNTWMGGLGAALVDGGNPVGKASTIGSDGKVTGGGGSNPVSGYSIITAADLAAAVKLAQGCPVLVGGASIEVCETFEAM